MKRTPNSRLFPTTHDGMTRARINRRRRMRGELRPRDTEPSFEWADNGRMPDDFDECAAVTVAVRGKLGAE